MMLCGDTEDDLSVRNAFRAMEVGYAVMDEAQEDPVLWQWLEALLNRRVSNPDDREMLQLAPLKPPMRRMPLKVVK